MGDEDRTPPRVRAIGGVFFRSPAPETTRSWYARHLGLRVDVHGTTFAWRQEESPGERGFTQWTPFQADASYLGAPDQQYMINYRVDDLDAMLEKLRSEGVRIDGEVQVEPYGRFAHIMDGDGRRVELWEPVDAEYEKILDGVTK
jgi:catechol 2,3-dioxygenase-like lactoylglutathione lyase family enzyme